MNLLRTIFRPRYMPTMSPSRLSRIEVKPPSLRHRPAASSWGSLMFWLTAPAPADTSPPLNRLPLVQMEFRDAIADIDADDATDLVYRISHAHSLRELWHLRTSVHQLIAQYHSEADAERRLAELNRHFPTRAPRSGFVPLSDA
jgi:hypothetical protein